MPVLSRRSHKTLEIAPALGLLEICDVSDSPADGGRLDDVLPTVPLTKRVHGAERPVGHHSAVSVSVSHSRMSKWNRLTTSTADVVLWRQISLDDRPLKQLQCLDTCTRRA